MSSATRIDEGSGAPEEATRPDEEARLAAVRRYDILDTPPDGAYDRITALAARLLGVPISIVSIVDRDRIWFKSHHGVDAEEVPRTPGLCASAIVACDPWLVTEASTDLRTLANPLVAGDFGLRFYAGVPLTTFDGHNLGTLCVIDREPRTISDDEVQTLRDLALVVDQLELRLSALRTVRLEERLRTGAEELAQTLREGLLPLELPTVIGLDLEARYHVANREEVGGDFYDVVAGQDGCAVVVGDVCGKGTKVASLTATAMWALRALTLDAWTPASAIERLNRLLVDGFDDPERYCTVAVASIQPRSGGGAGLTMALGGHPHPLVVRVGGAVDRLGETGPAIGWLAGATFTEVKEELARGDVVVMFTDGLLDAVDGHGSMDDTRLRRLLAESAGGSAQDIADHLEAQLPDAEVPTGALRDDAAFLVIRVA